MYRQWTVCGNDITILRYYVTLSIIWSFSFVAIKEIKMAKSKSSRSVDQPGSMLEQKTFQDFNDRKPSLRDPNEIKGKVNPENLNPAGQTKDSASDGMKDEMKPVPGTPRKRTTSNK